MKRFLHYILLVLSLVVCFSCGEDRTHELEEKTQHNHWIFAQLQDWYLWNDELEEYEPAWREFFAKPDVFLSSVAGKANKADKWSYLEIDTLRKDLHTRGHYNHIDSYGFDFVLMNDPTGQTTRSYARVITVYPNSPASKAGLARNDFISEFDSFKLSSNNASRLEKGMAKTLTVCRLGVGEESLFWEETKSVDLAESRCVEDVAFPVDTIHMVEGRKVGYVMCNRLLPSSEGDGESRTAVTDYKARLDGLMGKFADAKVDELVVDFRLCNFGTMEMARRFASYIVSPAKLNGVFAKTYWNANCSANNTTLPFDTSVRNLNLRRVYFITSEYTQGAAEWVIHSLQSAMGEENVLVIGKPSAGQNVMTAEVGNKYHISLFPAVAYVADGEGSYEYGSIVPECADDEFLYIDLESYGSRNEALLQDAIFHISNGYFEGQNVEEGDNMSESE
ncbi:MAG: hypothetical protein KBT29_07180 [Prevotellaceae bacterium]|nr:hypothetical protein [Candidatus Minthosoma caballi]